MVRQSQLTRIQMRLPCQKRAKENQKPLQGVVIGCDFFFASYLWENCHPNRKRAQTQSLKIETSMVNGKGRNRLFGLQKYSRKLRGRESKENDCGPGSCWSRWAVGLLLPSFVGIQTFFKKWIFPQMDSNEFLRFRRWGNKQRPHLPTEHRSVASPRTVLVQIKPNFVGEAQQTEMTNESCIEKE